MGIALLGPLEIDGTADVLGRRDRVVLTALAVRPGAVLSGDQLAEALWGDELPASWAKVVQGSVMRLRQVLGRSAIETGASGYRLVLGDGGVDVASFESLAARGRHFLVVHEPQRAVTSFEQALGLWRGRAFADLDTWDPAVAEAERLDEVRRAVEEDLVEARLASGRPLDAVAGARALVAKDGLRERRWALLALALYRSGRQPEALEAVRRASATLRDELGLDPGPGLLALEQAMLRQDPALLDVADVAGGTGETCPYQGLRPFDADSAEFFFGREEEVEECLARLAALPLLVVAGASGSGKSSLVLAGVVPRLAAGRRVCVLRPGMRPAAELAATLAHPAASLLLVVDQLEELFAAGLSTADVRRFLSSVAALVIDGTPVLVTIRADQLGGLAASPTFARLAPQGMILLTQPDEHALRLAVSAPAAQAGLVLEPGLVDLLVRDTLDAAGGLPLLSHALLETWEHRERNVLTVEGYLRTGGIRGAVALSAERLYDALPPADQALLRSLLLRLVTPLGSGEPVAAPVPTRVVAATADIARMLDLLVRARLVTVSADTATLAHEALIRAWPRLRAWLDEDRDGQRVLRHLQQSADGWDTLGRPVDELYRGGRLQAAVDWRARAVPVLSPVEGAFLAASQEREDRERSRSAEQLRAQVRRNRQLRLALGSIAALLVVALVAGSMAALSAEGARRAAARARLAAAEALAARLSAAALVEPRPDTSLLLSRQALAIADTPATRSGLLANLARQHGLVRISRPPESPLAGIQANAVAADGLHVLTDSVDGPFLEDPTLRGQASVLQLAGTFDVSRGLVSYVAGVTDRGRTALVSRTTDLWTEHQGRELVAFDATSGRQTGPAQALPGAVSDPNLGVDRPQVSPDGRTLLSVVGDSVRVWHLGSSGWVGPEATALPAALSDTVDPPTTRSVTFSTDGAVAAVQLELAAPRLSASLYPVVLVDTAASPPRVAALATGPSMRAPTAAALSPDGRLLALGDADGWVELRQRSGGPAIVERSRGTSGVTLLRWSDDGTRVVAGGRDGSLTVYAPDPLREVLQFPGGGSPVSFAAFAGHAQLVSQDDPGAITVHALGNADALMQTVPGGRVSALASDAAGTILAVGADDGHITLYDTRRLTRRSRGFSLGPYSAGDATDVPSVHRRVSALAISADGSTLVAGDRLGNLRMWSIADGRRLWSRSDVPTSFLALSPDGKRLATSGFRQDAGDRDPDGRSVGTEVTMWSLPSGTRLAVDGLGDLVNFDLGGRLAPPKPRALSFSPDSRLLAAGFSGDDRFPTLVYDASLGGRVASVAVAATALAFSPDSRQLLVRDTAGGVSSFTAGSGRQLDRFQAPTGGDSHLLFSSDRRWLVGSTRTAIDVWDARSRDLVLSQLRLPSDGSSDALFLAATASGHLFAATQTSLVDIDFDSTRWARIACSLAGRPLTEAELRQYLPGQTVADPCSR